MKQNFIDYGAVTAEEIDLLCKRTKQAMHQQRSTMMQLARNIESRIREFDRMASYRAPVKALIDFCHNAVDNKDSRLLSYKVGWFGADTTYIAVMLHIRITDLINVAVTPGRKEATTMVNKQPDALVILKPDCGSCYLYDYAFFERSGLFKAYSLSTVNAAGSPCWGNVKLTNEDGEEEIFDGYTVFDAYLRGGYVAPNLRRFLRLAHPAQPMPGRALNFIDSYLTHEPRDFGERHRPLRHGYEFQAVHRAVEREVLKRSKGA